MRSVAVIASPKSWRVGHGPDHPLKPERLERTYRLWQALGLLDAPNVKVAEARLATSSELATFHTPEYIQIVERLSQGQPAAGSTRFGFGAGDNPVFQGMFDSERRKVGGALQAAELILGQEHDVAFSYTGGLHHGGPDFACGFCVFNDIVVAIQYLLERELRVAYVDIDVHHGDGVQDAYYESAEVLTISLHQDGRTLFPGTGHVDEIGTGSGRGFSVNVPLPPATMDDDYLFAFDETVPFFLERFQPDVVVTQLGVDTHFLDPLAHLALTTRGQEAVFRRLEALCTRWLAVGGGGYNLDVVPRSWALALGVMAGVDLPDELPGALRAAYSSPYLRDPGGPGLAEEVRARNRRTIETTIIRLKSLHEIG